MFTTCHSVFSNATLKIYAQSCDYPVEEKGTLTIKFLFKPKPEPLPSQNLCIIEDVKQLRQLCCTNSLNLH